MPLTVVPDAHRGLGRYAPKRMAGDSLAGVRQSERGVAMRIALMTAVTLALLGCSGQSVPPAPSPIEAEPYPWLASFTVELVEPPIARNFNGRCIDGATVEIVSGPGTGRSVTQDCSMWDWYVGYSAGFGDLTPGGAATLRASAPGYGWALLNVELTVPRQHVVIHLSKIE